MTNENKINCSGGFKTKLMVVGHILGEKKLSCWNLEKVENTMKREF